MKIAINSNASAPDTAEKRYWADLLRNANSNDYTNEKGFKQKLIENLYESCYYEFNETIFLTPNEKE